MKLYLLSLTLLLMQTPGTPFPEPSASVEGMVTKVGTGEPVGRAQVMLIRSDRPGSASAITDERGHFQVRDIPPGKYNINVNHDGYARAGAARLSRISISLAPAQELKDMTLVMVPLGAISGRVYDDYGELLGNASVQAFKYSYQEGKRTLTIVQTARTNDLGEYRFYWLRPGSYIVAVSPTDAPDSSGTPRSLRSGTYAPVYFPGSMDPSGATPINLKAGDTFSGVDLRFASVSAVTVRGRAFDGLTGQPLRGLFVVLSPRESRGPVVPSASVGTSDAGVFEFRGIVPGSYFLSAMSTPRSSAPSPTWATSILPVEVGNADVENTILTVQPGFSIAGQISPEGPAGDLNLARINVVLRPEPMVPQVGLVTGPTAATGAFNISNVIPWTYRLMVNGLPRSVYLKSARMGGTDILNSPVSIDGVRSGALEIVIGAHPATFDGVVVDEKQTPVAGVTVVLVPDPARRSRYDLYRNATSDELGRVHIDGITPGDYKAFAWEEVEFSAWANPDFLETYESRGQEIHLDEGGKQSATLRSIAAPQ